MLGFILGRPPGSKEPVTKSRKQVYLFILLILIGAAILMSDKDFLIWKGDEPELAPWRKEKLEKELKEFDEAEQYALVVFEPGLYPCFNCYGKEKIYLFSGEIWKYGVSRKGQLGRYRQGLPHKGLIYKKEFEGKLTDCLKKEKLKIYNYALLPENLKREKPLIRPPGNKRDD